MKIVCAPIGFDFAALDADLNVLLYGQPPEPRFGSAGEAIAKRIKRLKLSPAPRAWDFLTIALSTISADLAGHRIKSPDGWTREFELHIAVIDKNFWDTQRATLESALRFLTTDKWSLHFHNGGFSPEPPTRPVLPEEDCAVLLSGGLDSFIGILDLISQGKNPVAVSQSVRGDDEKQRDLATVAKSGLRHIQLNHVSSVPKPEMPPSQRGRSIAFFAYGILTATTLAKHHAGEEVSLYVCENGFITINPPLGDTRLGSLSTRTCNPVFLSLLQQVVDAADLRVKIENPCRLKTKGEMLKTCALQDILRENAHKTTSCGRFKIFGYRHCGRCIPCLIRRASFYAWGTPDATEYVHNDLSIQNAENAWYDDVRSTALALAAVEDEGLERWLGAALASPLITDGDQIERVVAQGLTELKALLAHFRI